MESSLVKNNETAIPGFLSETEGVKNMHNLLMQAPVAIAIYRGPNFIVELVNDKMLEFYGKPREEIINHPIFEVFPEVAAHGVEALHRKVFETGETHISKEQRHEYYKNGKLYNGYFNIVFQALRDVNENITGLIVTGQEVTEDVQSRKKIEESKEQLRIALEAGELGLFDFYPQTGELIWSDRTKELFGLPKDGEVNYDSFLKGLYPDDKEISHAAIQEAMDRNNNGRYEDEYRSVGITDSKLRWVRSKGRVIFDEDGKPIRFTGAMQDITKHKEILRSLQLQSLVLERINEGVSVSDENGIIILTNVAEDKMFGYDAGELIGKHVTVQNAYPPDENERIVANVIAELKQNFFWSGEWHNRKKDGSSFYTFSFITQLQIDDTTLFICVQRDITEEKIAKEELAFRTALLEAHNETIPDAILIVDTKGKMLSFNQHFVSLWKIPEYIIKRKDDTAALQYAMTQLIDPQGFIERVNYCYQHPEETAHEEVLFKDGRIIERYGNAVTSEDGTSYGWAWYFRDITEQKLSELAIKENEERFRSMANSIPQLAWMTDAEGWIYWYNQRWYDYTGTTLEEMQGWGWQSVHHPDLVEKVKNDFTKAIAKGEPYEDTFLLRSKKGEYRWFLTRAVSIRNADGEIVQWFGTNTDVSDQRATEEVLKRTKDQLELTLRNVPSAIYHFDKAGNLLYLNEKGAHQLGFATVDDVLAEKDVFQFRKKLDETFAVLDENGIPLPADQSSAAITFTTGKSSEVVSQFINRQTGSSFWLLSKSSPLFDEKGELAIVLTTSTDISLQKNSEQSIRESEEKFRTLAETLPQLVWMTDEKGNYEYASSRWMDYSGLDPQKEDTWQKLVHPDDMQPLMDAWTKSLATGEIYIAEARLKSKSGEYRWHFVQGEPIRKEEVRFPHRQVYGNEVAGQGSITKWIGAFTDIHDQKTLTEKLEKLVAERTKELERSNEDLQQFAHVASHDMKEPLRKIKTFSIRIEDDKETLLSEKSKTYLGKVHSASDRLFSMIDGVLKYSTIDATEQPIEMVDVNKIIKNIEDDLEIAIRQKSAIIMYDQLHPLEGMPVLIYQLFYNLINNSLKFSKAEEPLIITITSKKVRYHDNAFTEIIVKDNGIGFEQRQAEHIFHTFTRLHSKDEYEGTGLGLALCKKIVERHHGTIKGMGNKNKGAEFIITLPQNQNPIL